MIENSGSMVINFDVAAVDISFVIEADKLLIDDVGLIVIEAGIKFGVS